MTTNRNSKQEHTACEKTRDNRFPRWLTPARDDDGKSVIGTTEVVPFPISRNVVFFRSLRSRALGETAQNGSLSATCEVAPFPEAAPMGVFCALASTRSGKFGNLLPSPRQPRAAVPT